MNSNGIHQRSLLGIVALTTLVLGLAVSGLCVAETAAERNTQPVSEDVCFPGKTWPVCAPGEVGLDGSALDKISEYLEGRGCIVRHGCLAYRWGDETRRGDVASAVKPWYSTFLFMAVEQGRLPSLNTRVADYVPELNNINGGELAHKDRTMTFTHMANQISCYGVREAPGTAFDYNDWQMALFADTLFLKLYGATWETVDEAVLYGKLTDYLQCEDEPTFLAFGPHDRPGRLAVSPRDFARLGWLYLNEGAWKGRQLVSPEHVRMATQNPLSNDIPRTEGVAAKMIPGQRSIGSRSIPDNQTDHHGSYSWLWWVNGVERNGKRYWPDAPLNTFAALGHANGMRGMAVLPDLDLVIAWNDTTLDRRPSSPHPLNEVFRLLVEAVDEESPQESSKHLVNLPEPDSLVATARVHRAHQPGRAKSTRSISRSVAPKDNALEEAR